MKRIDICRMIGPKKNFRYQSGGTMDCHVQRAVLLEAILAVKADLLPYLSHTLMDREWTWTELLYKPILVWSFSGITYSNQFITNPPNILELHGCERECEACMPLAYVAIGVDSNDGDQ